MKKRIINGLLILILIVSLGTTVYFIFDYYYDQNNSKKYSGEVPKQIKNVKPDPPIKKYVNELPLYRTQYNNNYIQGRLRIPNIGLELLVTRSEDNSHFLEYNLYNEYDGIGTAMFDFRNTDLQNNKQINIYGHNTENPNIYDKVPFKKLEALTDENTFKNTQDIYLDTDEKELHFKLTAVKISEKTNNEHMIIEFSSKELFNTHISRLLANSLFINENNITADDRVLIIQTCFYNPQDTYLILLAKEIKD